MLFEVLDLEFIKTLLAAGFVFGCGHYLGSWGMAKLCDVFVELCGLLHGIVEAIIGGFIDSLFNLNMENTMKRFLILVVIGALIGALIGGITGWLVSLVWPCVIVSAVAGAIGLPTFRIWPNWFSDRVPDWVPGAVMLVVCVMLGAAIGAATGWNVRGCGLGALFGCIVVGLSYGIRYLPLNVQ